MKVTVASYGGGVNSTAMLLGVVERLDAFGDCDWKPQLITFADTGGEKPETYAYVDRFSRFLERFGLPAITTVRYEKETLEENCLRTKSLPSIAYGLRKCSHKFKKEPQEKFCNNWELAVQMWNCKHCGHPKVWHFNATGTGKPAYACYKNDPTTTVFEQAGKVTRLIGYDAGEAHRIFPDDKKYHYVYLLVEWGWGREECIETILRHGLCVPPKSSCFYCPQMKELEIFDLRDNHPDLLSRALAIENNAKPNLITIKGLAREYSWQQILDYDKNQSSFIPRIRREMPCECYDGE